MKLGLGALALGVWVAAQAAAPVVTNITMVGATPRFSIQSVVGITNQIQCSTNLGQPNWTVLTNLVVTQSPYSFVDVGAPPAPRRFYRVVALNPAPTNTALIPAGAFTMGDTFSEGDSNELPTNTVHVSGFYMDKYEVTKALWDDVYNWAITHGYSFEYGAVGKATNHPAQSMTWYDAVKWCNARSEREGRMPAYYTSLEQTNVYRSGQADVQSSWVNWSSGYRLPTEAEWEKAARGGLSGQRFPWGNTISESLANYYGDTAYSYDLGPNGYNSIGSIGGISPATSPVGSFAANGYGLYDMAGNVWECCWDWYGSYSSGSQNDPRGPSSGSFRVFRGGGWDAEAFYCRTAYRGYGYPADRFSNVGFRTVVGQ
jgi:formylglycine-generating enzyme required for sulfatase activity